MNIFRTPGSKSLSVTAILKNVDFSSKTNAAIHGLGEDVTARIAQHEEEVGETCRILRSMSLDPGEWRRHERSPVN